MATINDDHDNERADRAALASLGPCRAVLPEMSDAERRDAIRSHDLERVPIVHEDDGRWKNATLAVCASCRATFVPGSSAEMATWLRKEEGRTP